MFTFLIFQAKTLIFAKSFCQNVEFKRFKIQKVNKQLIVYIVSCLFTLSAVCLHCQLFVCLFTFLIFKQKHWKITTFLPKWRFKLVIFKCLFTISAVCLQFSNVNNQLFVYFFNFQAKTLIFAKSFAKMSSLNALKFKK